MRTFVFILVVVVLLLVGLGFYREWFHIGTTSNPDTGQSGVQVTIDQNKVKEDVNKAKERVTPAKTETETR